MSTEREKLGLYTFVYFHYGGHGVNRDGQHYVVCNSADKKTMKYPLEKMLKGQAKSNQFIYILAVFDCCRHSMPAEMDDRIDAVSSSSAANET